MKEPERLLYLSHRPLERLPLTTSGIMNSAIGVSAVVIFVFHSAKPFAPTRVCRGCVISDSLKCNSVFPSAFNMSSAAAPLHGVLAPLPAGRTAYQPAS
jgi:hypothetical protein